MPTPALATLLAEHEDALLDDWMSRLEATGTLGDRAAATALRAQARNMLRDLRQALAKDASADIDAPAWMELRASLNEISRERAQSGFSPRETATLVFALKEPVFARLRATLDGQALVDALWHSTRTIDALGLYTTEAFQRTRDEIIARQQQELLELSTPVVELWDGILALPLIGTLDSARTQVVMETLLEKIVATGAPLAIIDITGVPTVDTLVAQHLLKTVAAARLMGADCIVSGIRPQIAQTIVHLGVDLGGVTTKATLAGAFAVALARSGKTVAPAAARTAA